MPPAIIAAAVTAAGTVGSSLIAKGAAKKAANAQVQAANQANELQKYMYDTTRSDQAPWVQAGTQALGNIQGLLANPTAGLEAQPAYQARLQEGINGVDRSATARGMLNSGGTLKALTRYGQTFASNELDNIFNRYASLAQIGQVGQGQVNQAGQNYANQGGRNLLSAGDARANGAFNSAAATNQALGGLTSFGQNLFSQFSQPQTGFSSSSPYSRLNDAEIKF